MQPPRDKLLKLRKLLTSFPRSQLLRLERNKQFACTIKCPTAPVQEQTSLELRCGQQIVQCKYCLNYFALPEDSETFCRHVSASHVKLKVVFRCVGEITTSPSAKRVDLRKDAFKRELCDVSSSIVWELCEQSAKNTTLKGSPSCLQFGAFVLQNVHDKKDDHLFCPFCCLRFPWPGGKEQIKLHIFLEHVCRIRAKNNRLCHA